jgi:RNA polymerase sigma-70 factor (ECF subfamily)
MTDRLLPFRRPERGEVLPDEALLAACAKGDNTAVEELFQRHGDRVHGVLARLGGLDQKDLEDVVQATFLTVQRSARRFDRRSAVGTWIVGIALNIGRRQVRGEVRRRSAMLAVAESHPRHPGAGPEEQASHRQLMGRLLTGFEALPADQRTVFVLCDLEGMRGVDVARALRIPEGTVWRRLHDARLRLRALVEAKVQP